MNGVVTWHQGRCGSSVLGSLLNQHSRIQAANEIFSKFMPRRRGATPVPAMAAVMAAAKEAAEKPTLNIEVKYLSAQNFCLYPGSNTENWLLNAHEHGFHRHVLIHRRNGLRRIVSHLMAQRTGIYVQQNNGLPTADRILTVDCRAIQEGVETHDLIGWLERYEKAHQRMQQSLRTWCSARELPAPLELIFEESIEISPQVAYRQMCAWLGEADEQPTLRLQRINPEPLSALISNWEEVQALLRTTPHAWMLHG